MTIVLGILHLDVAKGGFEHRIPVDDPFAAVNQALIVKGLKNLVDGHTPFLVQRKAFLGVIPA